MFDARHPDLAQLRNAVAVFDPLDLAAKTAALQLVPENVDRLVRLYGAVGVAATIPPSAGQPSISANKLRRFLNEPPLSDSTFTTGEDPFNNPFAEVLTFHGGSYVVFPGVDDDACFVFRHLAKAVLNPKDPLSKPAFMEEVRAITAFVLILSDEIASQAGLGRQVEAVTNAQGPVYTPGPEEMQSIIESAGVSPEEVMSAAHKDLRDAMAPPGPVLVPGSDSSTTSTLAKFGDARCTDGYGTPLSKMNLSCTISLQTGASLPDIPRRPLLGSAAAAPPSRRTKKGFRESLRSERFSQKLQRRIRVGL